MSICGETHCFILRRDRGFLRCDLTAGSSESTSWLSVTLAALLLLSFGVSSRHRSVPALLAGMGRGDASPFETKLGVSGRNEGCVFHCGRVVCGKAGAVFSGSNAGADSGAREPGEGKIGRRGGEHSH